MGLARETYFRQAQHRSRKGSRNRAKGGGCAATLLKGCSASYFLLSGASAICVLCSYRRAKG